MSGQEEIVEVYDFRLTLIVCQVMQELKRAIAAQLSQSGTSHLMDLIAWG